MEINEKQTIKGLECCTRGRKSNEDIPCLECPYNECNIVGGTSERQIKGTCQGWLMKDALALIKELTEDNERLRARVFEENHLRHQAEEMLANGMLVVRADSVRKTLERIKEDAISVSLLSNPPKFMLEIQEDALDQIAKEMLKGEK